MGWTPSPFVAALLVTSLVAAGLALVGLRHRDSTGAPAFVVMMSAVALWAYTDALQLSAGEMQPYRLWSNVSFLAAVVSANAGLLFAVQYTGRDHWVTRRTLALLVVEPAAIAMLTWTTYDHGLVWSFSGKLRTVPVSVASIDYGIAFHLHLLYTYVLMTVLLWLLVRFYLRSRGTYRWQTLLLLVGGLLPIVTNFVWLVVQRQVPPNIDPTPVMFVVTGLLFTVGLRSFDLLELAPVGRHTVVEELHDAVLTINGEGLIVDSNPVARELVAGSDESLIGQRAVDVVPQYEDLLEREGEPDDVATTLDGEPRYFDAREAPLTDAAEEVVGRVVLLRDVTKRRRVEKRYQLLIENSTDLITVLDEEGTVKYISPSVQNMLGADPDDILGIDAFVYIHPADRERVSETFAELVDHPDRQFRVEYRIQTWSGEYRTVESRGRNLLDDPVVDGIVVNTRDVTGRREREERLQQRNDQLEEFASVISHDLRNPLSVAHGYARLLEEEYDDERIGKISDAHSRMEELLEDLLTLAKEGRAVSEPEPVAISAAANQAWAIVDTSSATLAVEAERDLLADDTRLRQLLENLFANAAEHGIKSSSSGAHGDATGHGSDATVSSLSDGHEPGTEVTVRVGATDVGFYVADDGPGIAEAARDRVFDAGESSVDAGIGLGLTIVKRIADAHGWTVTVTESETGGARFEFSSVEWADRQ